jgi:Cu(I)/Ag(I) efflux system membrane fusion protein
MWKHAILGLALVIVVAGAAPRRTDGDPSRHRGTVLYWKAPDGQSDFSPTPKTTTDGRSYLPVYEDDEQDFKEATEAKLAARANQGRKILYYRNPMGLPDVSPTPKKDEMGMDYLPVYADNDTGVSEEAPRITLSPGYIQRAGVRTVRATLRKLARPIRAPAVVKPDERTLRVVTLRADAFIEALHVTEAGRIVAAGEPLFRFYCPQIVSAAANYRSAAAFPDKVSREELGALQRLRNLGLSETTIQNLRTDPSVPLSVEWPAPASGYVQEKRVVEGQMVRAGDELMRIVGLDTVWVIADVAEQDIAEVRIGAKATIELRGMPGRSIEGRVTFIGQELDPRTHTAKVRIEVGNSSHELRHEMIGEATIAAASSDDAAVVVPRSALIETGTRRIVVVSTGTGRFEPREVTVGARDDDAIAITSGIKSGEDVVVAAQFLIDSEADIRAALARLAPTHIEFSATPAAKAVDEPASAPRRAALTDRLP